MAVALAGTKVFLVFPLIALAALFLFVMRNPIWAAYIYIAAVPFIGGIDRGVIPLVRPNEALQGFLMVAVAVGALLRASRGEALRMRLTRLDIAVLAVAVLGSVWPICWM